MASNHRLFTSGHATPPLLLLLLVLTVTARSAQAQSSPSPDRPYFTNANFNPSMAIVIVVLISAFFFLGFFSIYIRQCAGAGDRASIRGIVGSAAAGRSRRQRGLDPEVLRSFPALVYSEVKEHKIGKGALECAVCLCEFEDAETLKLLPKCDHVFHPDCIDAWLSSHVTCPVCRSNLVPDPNEADKEIAAALVSTSDSVTPPAVEHVVTVDRQALEEEEDHRDQQADLERIINMKRAKSRARPVNLPRSHSTGHSLVQPGENLDRFTLRLPANVRKEIVAAGANLQRTRSLLMPAGEGGSRRGGSFGRTGRTIQLGRSDRWPSFLMRTLSLKVPAWGRRGEPDGSSKGGDGSMKSGKSAGSVRSPLDCLGGGINGGDDDKSGSAALNRL